MCQSHLTDQQLHRLLEKIDDDFAQVAQQGGCLHCEGKLHRADYDRKPRGGPQWDSRHSFCCAVDGCRRRLTPQSVRSLGRKVYAGVVVVLVSAMHHGLSPERVHRLREALGIDRRTLTRWREWWLVTFVESSFWKAIRARFMPPVCQATVPWSLCVVFEVQRRDRLLELLKFLAPITTTTVEKSKTQCRMAKPSEPSRSPERWAQFRFSVVGALLAAPPARGEVDDQIQLLATKSWRHPITGQWVKLGASTIERWY